MFETLQYDNAVTKMRQFFKEEKGFTEVPTQSRLSILAACEDPKTIGEFIWDGDNSEIIHYDYYKKTLSNIEGDVDVSVGHYQHNDTKSTEEQEAKYLSYFVKDHFNILPPEEDFLKEFNSSFKYKTMILSNSTWAWWVGFLSKCSNIYTFEKTRWFTPGNHRCHGIHIKNLYNIRNISTSIDGDFIDITKL